MTLRGRLTTAFLAVVLGPALLGAFFVGATVAAVSRDRSVERLDVAATTIRSSVGALCQQLHAVADAVALPATTEQRLVVADQVIARGLAAAVWVDGVTTPDAPPRPWTDCSGRTSGAFQALAVRVEMRDAAGGLLGSVEVAQVVDATFVRRLADAAGAAVTLRAGPSYSTELGRSRDAVVQAAHGVRANEIAESAPGRYVRRLDPSPGQPLPLALSVPRSEPDGIYAVLVGAVVLAGLLAVLAAWWLARSTTRPLAELGRAADRVADGDLAARVPVRARDEVGRLAAAFNRMTRETQSYVRALTASRDQLRNHLAVLGDTLSSTHDLHRILQVILQTALAATGARAGVVLLLDPATNTLVAQCAEGLEDANVKVPVGSGLLGTVAATGEPLRGRVDRDGPPLLDEEPHCRTYVAVPFAGPTLGADLDPPAVGVLALYDRLGLDEFDDADLVTLRTFAGQAAVAVDNVRVHEEAQRLSLTDPLTGLWNYRYLKESVRREVERASRFGRMLAVLALDLDRFKEVNDTHGHAAGDAVLTEFARRVRAEVREVDLAFRQGGEEFVVLLPETDAHGGTIVAQRLGAAVRGTPIPYGDGSIAVSVSIGIAVYPDHGVTGAQVLDAADDALYAAKAAGRDTYRIAAGGKRPMAQEMPVPAGAAPPDDDLPRAGGASPGTHPPRQTRGR
ncbi:GGDEF domain-containing protein [Phytohabitans kaempferiae]|uniref:Diguanylate cyclase n=1 Tax=Phytohabitans kaempferiae TaxID=1620943 RepID=A0ABV6M0L2_9ACTN